MASFPVWAWGTAHAWCHARVVEPLTVRPVHLVDVAGRQSWMFDIGMPCQHVVWAVTSTALDCPLSVTGGAVR